MSIAGVELPEGYRAEVKTRPQGGHVRLDTVRPSRRLMGDADISSHVWPVESHGRAYTTHSFLLMAIKGCVLLNCPPHMKCYHCAAVVTAHTHADAGNATQYFFAPDGQRYRSKNEVAKSLGIQLARPPKSSPSEKPQGSGAGTDARASASADSSGEGANAADDSEQAGPPPALHVPNPERPYPKRPGGACPMGWTRVAAAASGTDPVRGALCASMLVKKTLPPLVLPPAGVYNECHLADCCSVPEPTCQCS